MSFAGFVKGKGQVLALFKEGEPVDALEEKDTGLMVLDQTCFYAEGGGQVGDQGELQTGTATIHVKNCTQKNKVFFHHVEIFKGCVKTGETCDLTVNKSSREQTACHHSATHLLHCALKKVLGDHVQQKGSLVNEEYLRFDFSHSEPVTEKQQQEIEALVKKWIDEKHEVITEEMSLEDAKNSGAVSLFGEKYEEPVRVLSMGESKELCGGTHVKNTKHIAAFKIVSETGVSSGVRRMEALAGEAAKNFLKKQSLKWQELEEAWKKSSFYESQNFSKDIMELPKKFKEEIKSLEKDNQKLELSSLDLNAQIEKAKSWSFQGKDRKLVFFDLNASERALMLQICDQVVQKISGVVLVVGDDEDSYPVVLSLSKDLQPHLKAGQLLKDTLTALKGRGGGNPRTAQGGFPKSVDKKEMSEKLFSLLTELEK